MALDHDISLDLDSRNNSEFIYNYRIKFYTNISDFTDMFLTVVLYSK